MTDGAVPPAADTRRRPGRDLGEEEADVDWSDAIGLCLSGRISPQIAVARLLLVGAGAEKLKALVEERRPDPPTERWRALRDLLEGREGMLDELVREISSTTANHASFAGNDGYGPSTAVAQVAAFFDRSVAHNPEAGVALYSLGDPAILAQGTAEIVAWLDRHRLLAPDRDVLDLGCGIGRMAEALSPRCRSVVALDVAPRMVEEARRRHGHLPNVRFDVTDGTGLAAFGDGSLDLFLAADTFPYIVQSGLAPHYMQEAVRVLRPGGALAILNFSYRGDQRRDRAEALQWAAEAGLRVEVEAEYPFKLWDAAAWLLRRP